MTFSGRVQEFVYRSGSATLLLLLRLPVVADMFSRVAKVWLRHARIARHLRTMDYDMVVDGGANIGEFAALVRTMRPDVPLLCIEPHPGAAATLRRRGFEVVEAALWNEPGTAVLTQPEQASTSATLLGSKGDGAPSWTVSTVRLDQLPLTGKRILLKLDLQGAEPAALEGLGVMWDHLAGVLLEVSYDAQGTYEPLRALLGQRGFREAATFNELEVNDRVIEADKIWLRNPS